MGDRFVYASLTAPMTKATKPITKHMMVDFEDPKAEIYKHCWGTLEFA